jgi:hypothetical protein
LSQILPLSIKAEMKAKLRPSRVKLRYYERLLLSPALARRRQALCRSMFIEEKQRLAAPVLNRATRPDPITSPEIPARR